VHPAVTKDIVFGACFAARYCTVLSPGIKNFPLGLLAPSDLKAEDVIIYVVVAASVTKILQ
jgi:hypothetical protein